MKYILWLLLVTNSFLNTGNAADHSVEIQEIKKIIAIQQAQIHGLKSQHKFEKIAVKPSQANYPATGELYIQRSYNTVTLTIENLTGSQPDAITMASILPPWARPSIEQKVPFMWNGGAELYLKINPDGSLWVYASTTSGSDANGKMLKNFPRITATYITKTEW